MVSFLTGRIHLFIDLPMVRLDAKVGKQYLAGKQSFILMADDS